MNYMICEKWKACVFSTYEMYQRLQQKKASEIKHTKNNKDTMEMSADWKILP